MSKETFYRKIQETVQNAVGDDYEVKIEVQERNNETRYTFLSIVKCGENTYPSIHLDILYNEYQNGLSLKEAVDGVLATYRKCQGKMENISQNLNMSLTDWKSIREKLALCLVSKKRNENMLKQIVHKDMLDLAAVAVIVLSNESNELQTIKISYRLVRDLWKVTEEEVLNQAEQNTRKLFPPVCHTLYDELSQFPEAMGDTLTKSDFAKKLYLISNESRLYGATALLYGDYLKELHNGLGSDFYIFPSSVHECLILPKSAPCSIKRPEKMLEMVESINDHFVDEKDVLSDSVYYYDGKSLRIAATAEEDYHE